MLSCLANANVDFANPKYSELDALFVYNKILIEIYLTLVLKIPAKYQTNNY